MKISKLFHWLYAIVMLLPIFAIGVTCGYAMFNKNAYQSYENTYIKSSTLYTNDGQDIIGEKYVLTSYIGSTGNVKINYTEISIDWVTKLGASNQYNYDAFEMSQSYVYLYENNVRVQTKQFNNSTFEPIYFTNNGISSNFSYKIYLLTYQQATLSNVFYYSIDKVQQSPLFNWAENSFLVTPFAYIVNLFSMPTNSPIVMFLSYWLAISIIWLVFDLIMYVPLLVHRWLDKGVLE